MFGLHIVMAVRMQERFSKSNFYRPRTQVNHGGRYHEYVSWQRRQERRRNYWEEQRRFETERQEMEAEREARTREAEMEAKRIEAEEEAQRFEEEEKQVQAVIEARRIEAEAFSDLLRHILRRMPHENAELPQFFDSVEQVFVTYKVPAYAQVELMAPFLTDQAAALVRLSLIHI